MNSSNKNFANTGLHTSTIIKKLMDEVGVIEAELARQTGLPQTTINRLLLGDTLSPRANTLIPIAKFFGITVDQLLGLKPISNKRISGTFCATNKDAWTIIPIIQWNEIPGWLFKKEQYVPSSETDWITTEQNISPNSFALRSLEFMEPRFRKNSIIIVDPDYQFMDSSFVVLSIGKSTPTVRRIIKDGDEYYLKKLHGNEPTVLKDNSVMIYGTIVETRIKER